MLPNISHILLPLTCGVILLKHGFKPRDPAKVAERERELDIDLELNTIPNHVLHDELLYRKYMERELGFQYSRIPDSQVSGFC